MNSDAKYGCNFSRLFFPIFQVELWLFFLTFEELSLLSRSQEMNCAPSMRAAAQFEIYLTILCVFFFLCMLWCIALRRNFRIICHWKKSKILVLLLETEIIPQFPFIIQAISHFLLLEKKVLDLSFKLRIDAFLWERSSQNPGRSTLELKTNYFLVIKFSCWPGF